MKKILAVLVTLMMLMTAVASAEPVFSLADPVVTVNMGEAQTIDLTGAELSIAAGEIDGVAAIQIDINGNGDKLMGISANVVGDKAVFAVDGVSGTYYVQMPAGVAEVAGGGLDLSGLDLSGLDIDFDALLNGIEMDGDTIRVPYTVINDVLESIAPALEGVEIAGINLSGLTDAVTQLKESNSGINLEGTYAESDSGMSVSAAVIPVENGEAGEAVFNVNFDMDDNGVNVRLEVPGQGSFYFSTKPVDEKIQVTLGGEAQGMGFELSGVVSAGEADVAFTALDADGAIDIQSLTDEQREALTGELTTAASGLIAFVFGALSAAA